MSDEAVLNATGWDWESWVIALDNHRAYEMSHREIAALIARAFEGKPWWAQMVAVGYERLKGLRVKNQKAAGFEVSASRTFGLPVFGLRGAALEDFAREQEHASRWAGGRGRRRVAVLCERRGQDASDGAAYEAE